MIEKIPDINRRAGWVREIESLRGVSIKFRSDPGVSEHTDGSRETGKIKGYLSLGPNSKRSCRLLIDYIDEITVDAQLPISEIRTTALSDVLGIDATTRANLELVANLKDGGTDGTLFQVMDLTRTAAGRRLLRNWILYPLTDLNKIKQRLGGVRNFCESQVERDHIQDILRYITDFERVAARIELGIVSPAELGALRNGAELFPEIKSYLNIVAEQGESVSDIVLELEGLINIPKTLVEALSSVLVDNPPPGINDGGIIKEGFSAELDRLRDIKSKGREWLVDFERREKEATGISSLKVKYNNVHGYFIEVTLANIGRVPEHYTRKQTMANAERYITEELKELEKEVLGAEEKQKQLERNLFTELRSSLRNYSGNIRSAGRELARLDVLLCLSELAERDGLVEPLLNSSGELRVKDGKHPVIAKQLKGSFIPNSVEFKGEECCCFLITGANMGGKSTYLRQVALIVIMAQLGSFVPATRAEIGLVDRVFARLGASDDLLEGESTFMVEMREAAHIVSNATSRSLLLIDEIGRGTATSDGLVIAQAILEWIILRIKCRTLFATHFHELTVLDEKYPYLANCSVGSVEEGDRVIFTHEICDGAANKSYGLEVALLAGLPSTLVSRARELLKELDVDDVMRAVSSGSPADSQLSFFEQSAVFPIDEPKAADGNAHLDKRSGEVVEPFDYKRLKDVERSLEDFDINKVTPLEALNFISSLKSSILEEEEGANS